MFCVKDFCEIYRDKKYCSRASKREVCDCRHAVYACQTGLKCGLKDVYKCKGPLMIEAITRRADNG